MANPWDTPTAGSSSGGGGNPWDSGGGGGGGVAGSGNLIPLKSSGGGGGFFGSHFLHQVEALPAGVVAGVAELGHSVGQDVGAMIEHPLTQSSYHWEHTQKNIIDPTLNAYGYKYGGLMPGNWDPTSRQFWLGNNPGQSFHRMGQDPLGTVLDVATLGTLPFGGEGAAIRGFSVADRLGLADTKVGTALAKAAEAANLRRADLQIAYKPNEAAGGVFSASRARTVQGRYIYNPIREAVGRAHGGTLPLVGNAARLARAFKTGRIFAQGDAMRQISEFENAISANIRPSLRLSKAERVAVPLMAEYGPQTARDAELGAVRQQRIAYYQSELDKTKQALEAPNLQRRGRGRLQAEARAQQRVISLLSDAKMGQKIDEAIKNPSDHLQTVLDKAQQMAESQRQLLINQGIPEQALEDRRFLPQRMMHGTAYERAKTIGYEQTPANFKEAKAAYDAALGADAGLPKGIPDATTEQQWIAQVQKAQEDLKHARTVPGKKRPIINPAGFAGGEKTLGQIKAEHPDAFYYPHLGAQIHSETAHVTSASLADVAPGVSKLNQGVRFRTGQYALGPEQYSRAFAQTLKYESTRLAAQQLKDTVAIPYDGHNLRPGYVPINPDSVSLTRAQKEAASLDEHFQNLTDAQHAQKMDEILNEMFPPNVPGQVNAQLQVPEAFVKSIRGDYKRSGVIARNMVDKPLQIWKALVLRYRPAWLVNNIFGQHLLLFLHSPLGWNHYVAALTPSKRAELARSLQGLSYGGTSELVRTSSLRDLGFDATRRGRIKSGEIGGIVGKAAYRSVSYPARVVKSVGDLTGKLNIEIADNQTRLALGRKYVAEYRNSVRAFEAANGILESAVKGKTLEQIAREMPQEAKIQLLRKVNYALGNFNTLTGTSGRNLRRAVPFASWFKVILEITRDLTIDHPEKLLLAWNLEQAAKKDPSVTPQFDVPSWFMGSLVAPFFSAKPGEQPLLSMNTANPFATPQQLADQLSILFQTGQPTGTTNPVASLGPGAEAINLLQGFDPFYGGPYQGPGDKSAGAIRVAEGLASGLPPVRLANQAGLPLTGKYKAPASYTDRYATVAGVRIPLDAILRYMGLPLRRANIAKLQQYAAEGK